MIEMALKLEIVWWMNAVAPFIGNVQLSNIMLRNQQVCVYKNVILYKVAYQQQQQQF